MVLPINITGEIFGWPSEFEESLFKKATLARVDDQCLFINLQTEHRSDLLAPRYFTKDCWVA